MHQTFQDPISLNPRKIRRLSVDMSHLEEKKTRRERFHGVHLVHLVNLAGGRRMFALFVCLVCEFYPASTSLFVFDRHSDT